MARFTDVLELMDGAVKVTSEALPYEQSEDLLPEVAAILSGVLERVAPMIASGQITGMDDALKLAPALGGIAAQLGGGKLKSMVPKILAGTSVVMPGPDGEKIKYDLIKKDERAACFEAHPEYYFQILFFAGKVTFGRFFRVGGLPAKDSQTVT